MPNFDRTLTCFRPSFVSATRNSLSIDTDSVTVVVLVLLKVKSQVFLVFDTYQNFLQVSVENSHFLLPIDVSIMRNVTITCHKNKTRKFFLHNLLTSSLFNFEIHVENGQFRVIANCEYFLFHVLDQNRIIATIAACVWKFDVVFEQRSTPYWNMASFGTSNVATFRANSN